MPRAERDILGIYQRISAQHCEAPRTWFRAAIRSLRDNPHRSATTPENENLRHLVYGIVPNINRVIYQVVQTKKEVNILHIRHGARREFRNADLS